MVDEDNGVVVFDDDDDDVDNSVNGDDAVGTNPWNDKDDTEENGNVDDDNILT
jgi:hypothetical protein